MVNSNFNAVPFNAVPNSLRQAGQFLKFYDFEGREIVSYKLNISTYAYALTHCGIFYIEDGVMKLWKSLTKRVVVLGTIAEENWNNIEGTLLISSRDKFYVLNERTGKLMSFVKNLAEISNEN